MAAAGEHTRSIAISTPSAASSGIMRFAKKKVQCLGCRQPLQDATATLCSHCKPNVPTPPLSNLPPQPMTTSLII